MSSDAQEQIISSIFERRPIWNSKDVNHKNRRIINQLWEEIKNELNIEDMFLPRFFFNFLVADFTVLIDVLNYKNVHQIILNSDTKMAVSTFKNLYETNTRLSRRNNITSSFPYSYQKIGVIVNTSYEDWEDAFVSIDETIAFRSPFIWIVITGDLKTTVGVFSRYPIEVDSDVTIIQKENSNFNLYEIYNTGFTLGGKVIVRNIGFWDKTLHVSRKDRLNLEGLVLRTTVVITNNQRFSHKTFNNFLDQEKPSLTSVDSIHKLKYYEILKYYTDLFNISYEYQRSNSWGYPTHNGTFDGMVGALQRFEADIGGSPIFVRIDRSMAVDYAAETWQTRPCFIFRHPKHSKGYYTIYTRPLSTNVWFCIVAFLVLTTAILGLMIRMKRIKVPGDDEEESASLVILFIWGAICQQGMIISRTSIAIKMVIFVVFIYALTLYQYYNALVVSTLLQAPPKNIKTMKDLLTSNLKAGVEDVLYNKDFFKRTTDPLAIRMYHKRIVTATEYNFYPIELGMTFVKKGGFAFHVDSAAAYRIMQNTFSSNEICDATEIPMYVPQNTGAAVAKRSPYREHIAYGIRKMKERGLMRRLQTYWDASRPVCTRTPDSSLISVSLMEFQTALIVLAVGYLLAVIILLLEVLLKTGKTSKWVYLGHRLLNVFEFRN